MAERSGDHVLSISDLADRTGVAAATLRSWESRYGFPRPARLAGGHRRYSEADVGAVREVLRHRDSGLALEVAVRRATTDTLRSRSVYAELRRRHSGLRPQLLSKPSLLALSRAIEDECCSRAEEPLLVGAFQRSRFLVSSYTRWAELARTARVAVVFVDHAVPDGELPGDPRPGSPVQVALPPEAPLNREWIVVCDSADLPACMVAVERPGQDALPDARRRFEAIWTVDPATVRHASRVALALADEYRPGWRPPGLALDDGDPPAASSDLLRATDLLTRTMGYLDAVP